MEAHKKMGYPALEKSIQCKIMETGDLSPIGDLVPSLKSKGTPFALLKNYITISKSEFKNHLNSTDFLEKQKIENAPNPHHDGVWIKGSQIIAQERGQTHQSWDFKTNEEAIEVFTNLLWKKLDFK